MRRAGLSPRVRGNRLDLMERVLEPRSIPACAGEPRRCRCQCPACQVYPRVCGGTRVILATVRANAGLSPRVRGNPTQDIKGVWDEGSIPACAGGTVGVTALTALHTGLSPRVRGNRIPVDAGTSTTGSIPACAGEPISHGTPWRRGTVYPRVCGGTVLESLSMCCVEGLSPRVRGNPSESHAERVMFRSIPACAGEPAGLGSLWRLL